MSKENRTDIALVGGGIMCATLAAMIHELDSDLSIQVFERLEGVALESAEAMNNAGTGHAAYCELNYTPEKPDGTVEIPKALTINSSFEISMQFWSYLVEKGLLPEPRQFLNPIPHMSFVWGAANVAFLRARHAKLSAHPMFADMRITEDPAEISQWAPLLTLGREPGQPLALTRVNRGTDVDFGKLARMLFAELEGRAGYSLHLNHEVRDLRREADGRWAVRVKDRVTGETRDVSAKFVFLGGGGGSLPLLLKSGIPEGNGYGGFPVSGEWLVCHNPEVIEQHQAKVYGKASLGAPPMSVPHLDTRMIDGRRALLFGPYAGFTTKYLKRGSYFDLPGSLRFSNLKPMLAAGLHNLDLTRYLIGQVLQSHEQRVAALREFMPTARPQDWTLDMAGQRVQIIKRDPKLGGKLEFGTEVVASADGSLAALLGASPGASTAVHTMIEMLQRCFPQAKSEAWQAMFRRMVPSHGVDLTKDFEVLKSVRDRNDAVLGLDV